MFEGLQHEQLTAALEALLFVTDEPASALALARMLEVSPAEIEQALEELQKRLEEDGRGIQLREVSGGWRLYTHPIFHDLIEKYVLSWDTRRMSQAALEVLAIVAYGQPVTRAEISSIRGVTSDTALNTLVERGFVRELGTLDTPGNPIIYGTTQTFLEKFGLRSPEDLPDLEEFAPDEKTAELIRERLGAPSVRPDDEGLPNERDLPTPEQMVANVQASLLGAVEKIDFDKLVFDEDDDDVLDDGIAAGHIDYDKLIFDDDD